MTMALLATHMRGLDVANPFARKRANTLSYGTNAIRHPMEHKPGPKLDDSFDRALSAIKTYGKDVVTGQVAKRGLKRLTDLGDRALAGDIDAGIEFAEEFGGMGTIGGQLAKTANLFKLEKAKILKKAKTPRKKILDETGWFQGVDGKWRFEIDDSAAQMKPGIRQEIQDYGVRKQSTAMKHPDLYEAYPSAGDEMVRQIGRADRRTGILGSYGDEGIELDFRSLRKNKDLKSTNIHELQHAIQQREGFARGGSPDMFGAENMDTVRLKALWKKYADEGLDPMTARTRAESDLAMENYKRLAGEAEARAVQSRMNLTPDQRAARPFWEDFDVPESDQIVRYGDDVAQMADDVSNDAVISRLEEMQDRIKQASKVAKKEKLIESQAEINKYIRRLKSDMDKLAFNYNVMNGKLNMPIDEATKANSIKIVEEILSNDYSLIK